MPTRKQSDTVQLKVRMKEPLRALLEKNADKKGVSLNSEVVDRLELSFAKDAELEKIFGNEQTFSLLKAIGGVFAIVEAQTGKRWDKDEDTYGKAQLALYGILNNVGPLPHAEFRKYMRENKQEQGLSAAKALLKYAGFTEVKIDRCLSTLNGE